MKRIVLLTALVITSLCAWAQQLRTPFKMAESNREYLQHGVRHMTSPLGQKSMQRYSMQPTDRLMLTDLNSRRIAAKTLNTNYELVNEQPAGEVKMFYRSGKNYYTVDGTNFQTDDQHGLMKVVFDPDGKTVWFKEIMMDLAGYNSWVKGTYNEDKTKINVELGQTVGYLSQYNQYLLLYMFKYDEASQTFVIDEAQKQLEVAVEGESLKMLGTDSKHLLSMVYSSNNAWVMLGDYETVLAPFNEVAVEVPEGLTTKDYMLNAVDKEGKAVTTKVKMGEVGNDVYVQGLLNSLPEGWLKGKKEANKVTFANKQFVGIVSDFYPVWGVGANSVDDKLVEADFVLNFNEASKTYTSDMFLLENVLKDEFGYIDYYYNVTLMEYPDVQFTTDIITEQPEGELKAYKRSGTALSTYMGYPYVDPQDGYIMFMVYAPDSKTVYLKNPVTQARANTWVKATKEGNKIVMPLYQSIDYSENGDYYIYLAKVVAMNPNDEKKVYVPDFSAKNVTFSIDEATGVVSLDELKDDKAVLGLVFSNNMSYNNFADFNSVYTPLNEEITLMPENLKQEKWSVIYNEEGETADGEVVVAMDGDKLYMNSILDLDPKATLVGTIKGNKVEFATDQYLGLYPKADATAYFGGAKYRIEQEEVIPGTGFMMDHWYYDVTPSLVMDYDAEKRTLTAPEGTTFLLNATKPSVDVMYIWALSDAYFAFKSEIAGIDNDLTVEGKEVKSVKYFNLKGMQIAKPEKGVCIQAVTFTDGSTMTKKMVR